MQAQVANEIAPFHGGASSLQLSVHAWRQERAVTRGELPVCLYDKSQGFLEIAARFGERTALRVDAGDLLNVGDIRIRASWGEFIR
jgi:hypothetical protein